MSSGEARFPRGKILVTGISGTLGRLVAKSLHRMVEVVGIDRRPFVGRPKDVEMHRIDIRRKKAEDILRTGDIGAVVHLNIMHDPRATTQEHHSFNIVGTTRILEYCHRYRIPKVVVLSSANIYGPRPDNNQFLTEDAPILGGQADPGIRDLIEIDMYACSYYWKYPEMETVVLRPVHIVGSVKNAPSNYLRLKVVPTIMGFDPMVQLVHEEDVVDALVRALRPGVRGVFNVVGPGVVPLSVVVRELGKRRFPLPLAVGRRLLDILWRWRITSFPPPQVDHVRFGCIVDGSRAREVMGYMPRKTLRETLNACVEGEAALLR